jgi:hypothetical protein
MPSAACPAGPNEFYFGAVNGGVWKTVDAGRVWTPIFDTQSIASIGALAVAPSSPDTIYVGSGESTLRDSVGYGNGMYKSSDAGRSWTHIGLDDTQHIGKVAVDPRNPNIVFVAAIGHLYDAHPDRGVFRSQDGGRTWQKVLFKNDSVGAVDVVIDPTNSQIVYASLWNTRRPTWYTYQPTNGPGGGIYKSTNGGTTWTQLANGLPTECVGRSGLAVAPSNPRRVYAVVDDFPAGGRTGRHAVSRHTAWTRRGRRARPPVARQPHRQHRRRAASIDRMTPARRGRKCPATMPSGVADGTSRKSPSIQKTRTSSTCRTCRCRDRKTAARPGSRCAGHQGGRLPSRLGLARRLEHDHRRERSGRRHQPQWVDRRSTRRHVEFVAQPAHRADLPRVGGLSISLLGRPAHSRIAARSPCARAGSSQAFRCATGNRLDPAAKAA